METDKHIEVADNHFVTTKQTRKVQINMRDNDGKPFITTLYNLLFAPDLSSQLFTIIKLMDLGHICLFHKNVLGYLHWNYITPKRVSHLRT